MKHPATNSLKQQLTSSGASDSEATELVAIASSLKRLNNTKHSVPTPVLHNQQSNKWRRLVLIGTPSLAGLVIGMAVVILSQTVLPGSFLYPVQKLSDHVAVAVNPDYRGIIMMKRAQQVKQLVAEHASSPIVLATLADYKNEASAYKSVSAADYAAFEYCKSNLQQAAAAAPNADRQAINTTLSSLNDV